MNLSGSGIEPAAAAGVAHGKVPGLPDAFALASLFEQMPVPLALLIECEGGAKGLRWAILEDLAESRRLRAEIRARDDRFQELFESFDEGVFCLLIFRASSRPAPRGLSSGKRSGSGPSVHSRPSSTSSIQTTGGGSQNWTQGFHSSAPVPISDSFAPMACRVGSCFGRPLCASAADRVQQIACVADLVTARRELAEGLHQARQHAAGLVQAIHDPHGILTGGDSSRPHGGRAMARAGALMSSETLAGFATRVATSTPREREVMDRLLHGDAIRAIASALDLSPKTIKVYRACVTQKILPRWPYEPRTSRRTSAIAGAGSGSTRMPCRPTLRAALMLP